MKYLVLLLFLVNPFITEAKNLFFSYNYQPEPLVGIKSDSLTRFKKPTFNPYLFTAQHLAGTASTVLVGVPVGFLSGHLLYQMTTTKEEREVSWGGLFAPIFGAFVGYVVVKPIYIHVFGNRESYKGNLWLTMGTYLTSTYIYVKQAKLDSIWDLIIMDVLSTSFASVVHFYTLQPIK
ncbi:MAG: hypothetical protein GW823_01975 [Bacteroidetes bacterium]|nr:hypothetical protein [Bacteroidota bacterium]